MIYMERKSVTIETDGSQELIESCHWELGRLREGPSPGFFRCMTLLTP